MRRFLPILLLFCTLAFAGGARATTVGEGLSATYSSSAITSSTGIWNSPVPAGAQLDPNSAAWSQALWRSMGINDDGTFVANTQAYRWASGYYVYTVEPSTPWLTACSRFTASGQGWSWMDQLHGVTMTEKVPVPTGALSYDGGGDHSMAIYMPAADGGQGRAWEFYEGLDDGHAQGSLDAATDTFTGAQLFVFNNMPVKLYRYVNGAVTYLYGTDTTPLYTTNVSGSGFQVSSTPSDAAFDVPASLTSVHAQIYDRQGRACNRLYSGGGRMRDVATNPGYFIDSANPVESQWWGRQATGAMPVMAGLLTTPERNAIMDGTASDAGHVLSFVVPGARCGVRFWPALRNDCNGGGKQTVPEGAWIKLGPAANCGWLDGQIAVETQAWRLHYLRFAEGLCRTLQRFGARVVDQTGGGGAWKYAVPGAMSQWTKDAPDMQGGGYRSYGDYSSMMPWTTLQVLADSTRP